MLSSSDDNEGESLASLRQNTHLVNISEELSLVKVEKGLSHPSHWEEIFWEDRSKEVLVRGVKAQRWNSPPARSWVRLPWLR